MSVSIPGECELGTKHCQEPSPERECLYDDSMYRTENTHVSGW